MAQRFRWIGDPAERAEGRVITPGPWLDLPADIGLAGKIMGNNHYEIEGIPVITADEAPAVEIQRSAKRNAPKKSREQLKDEFDLSEESGGWN